MSRWNSDHRSYSGRSSDHRYDEDRDYNRDRRSHHDRDYGTSYDRNERRGYSDRDHDGYNHRGNRNEFGGSGQNSYVDRRDRDAYGDGRRDNYHDRDAYGDGRRDNYHDRGNYDNRNRSFNDRGNRDAYGDRSNRGHYDNRQRGGFNDRSVRGGHNDRSNYGDRTGHNDRNRFNTPYGRGGGNGRGGRGGRGGGRGGGGDHSFDPHPNMGPVQELLPEQIEVKNPKDIQVNCSQLNITNAIPVYQYELKMKGFKGKYEDEEGIDLCSTPKTDSVRNSKYRALNEVFKILLDENPAIFKSDEKDEDGNFKHLYVFDRSCLFYSDLDFNVDVDERTFSIDARSIPYENRTYIIGVKTIEVRLVKTGKLEPANILNHSEDVQRPVLQYLDILFDQLAYKEDRYFVFKNRMFFKDNNQQIVSPNYILKRGFQKNIRITENGFVLQVDSKKTCFYAALPLIEFLKNERFSSQDLESPNCKKDILERIKGLHVRTTHMEFNQVFMIPAMSDLSADDIVFNFNGIKTSVAEYFQQQYNLRLGHPEYLCVDRRGSFFPIEVLEVVDGQRVQRERMSVDLNQNLIRACQMKPVDLLRGLDEQLRDAGFENSNYFLKLSGISIISPRLEVLGQEIPKPAIVYGDGIMNLRGGAWRQDNATYLQSGAIEKLAVIVAGRTYVDERRWVNDLIGCAEEKGVRIRQHEIIALKSNVEDRDGVMKFACDLAAEGFDFLLFLSDSKDLHQTIKFSEIVTKVCTQQVKMDSMKKGRDTLFNIINKINLKAGGRNYSVATDPEIANRIHCDIVKSILDTTCIFGIEMSHPAAQDRADRALGVESPEPTTVGIAHTVDSTGCVANGDYFYIPRGSTVIDHPKLVNFIINALREFHLKSGKHAERLLIYRSGISESAFVNVILKECGSIIRAIDDEGLSTVVTMVVVQQKSNHRLFHQRTAMETMNPQVNAMQQNVGSGTSIRSGVTNPRYKEFIMISHRALLGTAKPIVGTLIFESAPNSFTVEQLEQITNALCYQHEIVSAPIALPGPLRSASDLAHRGHNNWKFAASSGSLTKDDRDYQREYTAEESKALAQQTFDRHYESLSISINNKKFWA